jgi:2-polyprenyl-3-methyl-5-hydroxy-6-metoxy-1,4-benzoquinol methylase
MRYGMIPQSPEEHIALERAPHIQVLFDPFLPLIAARSLLAFVRLGIARALVNQGKSVDDLAAELNLQVDGLRPLLRVLHATGYVALENEAFQLTPLSRAALVEGAPAQLDAWVLHNSFHWKAITEMETVLTSRGKRDVHHMLESQEAWAVYQQAMLQTARPAAGAVAEALPEPPERDTVLDLGGSHGLYGAAVCRRFPGLRCIVIDLPEAVEHARKLGAAEGLADVVTYEAGNILTTNLGRAEHDVVFMGNIVHHFDRDQFPGILRRSHQALKPGGIVAIWDMTPPTESPEPDLVLAGFSLLFHLTSASTCRSPEYYVSALNSTGFVDTMVHPRCSPTHQLITARRASQGQLG